MPHNKEAIKSCNLCFLAARPPAPEFISNLVGGPLYSHEAWTPTNAGAAGESFFSFQRSPNAGGFFRFSRGQGGACEGKFGTYMIGSQVNNACCREWSHCVGTGLLALFFAGRRGEWSHCVGSGLLALFFAGRRPTGSALLLRLLITASLLLWFLGLQHFLGAANGQQAHQINFDWLNQHNVCKQRVNQQLLLQKRKAKARCDGGAGAGGAGAGGSSNKK